MEVGSCLLYGHRRYFGVLSSRRRSVFRRSSPGSRHNNHHDFVDSGCRQVALVLVVFDSWDYTGLVHDQRASFLPSQCRRRVDDPDDVFCER